MIFEFSNGYIEIDEDGDIWIRQDEDRIVIERRAMRGFFEASDAARDEVFPPGPIQVPDPVRHEEVFARINENAKQPFDPKELKGALGQLAAAAGNVLQEHRRLS